MPETKLPTKTYCYNARDALNGNKLVGGMLHAFDMEDAAKRAIKRCKVTVVTDDHGHPECPWKEHHLMRNGKKVYLYVCVHPENLGLT